MSLLSLMEKRHSEYALNKNLPVSIEKVEETLGKMAQMIPTAFHSQSARMMILEAKQHDRFWELVEQGLRKIVPVDRFEGTAQKLAGFKAAYGTLLFFDETKITYQLEKDYPLYAANFEKWAEQGNGMLTLGAWLALRELGIGANLQHYSEVVEPLLGEFNIPSTYRLIGQMPFGGIENLAEAKESLSEDSLVHIRR